jgi:hypothetical protein
MVSEKRFACVLCCLAGFAAGAGITIIALVMMIAHG